MNDPIIKPTGADVSAFTGSPAIQALSARHKEMLDQILRVVGKQTDEFLKACALRVFPETICTFLDEAKIQEVSMAALELTEAVQLVVKESIIPGEFGGGARVRTVLLGVDELIVGRLTITMAEGNLLAKREFNENLVPPSLQGSKKSFFDITHPPVRFFLWRMCTIPQCRKRAELRYGMYYDCSPEPTEAAARLACNPRVAEKDSGSGVEQRSEPNRGPGPGEGTLPVPPTDMAARDPNAQAEGTIIPGVAPGSNE